MTQLFSGQRIKKNQLNTSRVPVCLICMKVADKAAEKKHINPGKQFIFTENVLFRSAPRDATRSRVH